MAIMNIENFRAAIGDVARAALFEVVLNFPGAVMAGGINSTFFCKGSQLPSCNIGEIPISFMGRKVYQAGDRDYEPWVVTIIQDSKFIIRNAVEQWQAMINLARENRGAILPSEYQVNSAIFQLNAMGARIKEYEMINMWPSTYDVIDVNWDSTDTPEEFGVTFRYDYWVTPNAPA